MRDESGVSELPDPPSKPVKRWVNFSITADAGTTKIVVSASAGARHWNFDRNVAAVHEVLV
ncbi:hypothetical protein [Microbacterium rhizomatis]|uniref:Uncharacterized protein n=1 Tax=Microbacterium rhizomatis TaxID=1631477 RepID=A0A5J5J758_9MICO|nr:hypothetical protein [Microbacterium rhizomatis]KAA9110825.1 hypothetical protein F6B43_04090 [Microbacterium rhizomatis]